MQINADPQEAIELAARWLPDQPDHRGRALVPELRERFGITTAEAIEALRRAHVHRFGKIA